MIRIPLVLAAALLGALAVVMPRPAAAQSAAPLVHAGPVVAAPDGRLVAQTFVPAGAETAHLAHTVVRDAESGALLADLPGHSPRWEPLAPASPARPPAGMVYHAPAAGGVAGTYTLLLEAEGESRTYTLGPNGAEMVASAPLAVEARYIVPLRADAPPEYPAAVRIVHHAANGCRPGVEVGEVTEVPFDEYVARVLPAEVPARWQAEALKAQAVAVRTYAWSKVLEGKAEWDLTDWANYQMMCDDRYPATDAAAAATAGLYLHAAGDEARRPIVAMYSAENGHPTLTNPYTGYLRSVPDLYSLGRERNGHGYGLSQWGAQRRALAGHTFAHILGHYYTGVRLTNALDAASAPAALLGPEPDGAAAYGLDWRVLRPADTQAALRLTLGADPAATTTITGDSGHWRLPAHLPEGGRVQATLTLSACPEGEGCEAAAVYSTALMVDRAAPPPPAVTAPAAITLTWGMTAAAPVYVEAEAGSRAGLTLGRRWEGEELPAWGAVEPVDDPAAANGRAAHIPPDAEANPLLEDEVLVYGPYTRELPAGQSYRALFWLRAGVAEEGPDATAAEHGLARLEVTDGGGEEKLGLRLLRPGDLPTAEQAGGYAPVAVDFHLFAPAAGLELRLLRAGPHTTDLYLDRVEIYTLPAEPGELVLPLGAERGELVVEAAAFDAAGNVSATTPFTLTVVDAEPGRVYLPGVIR